MDRSYMEEPGSKASVRSRDGIQGNVLLYIGFYNNSGILLCVCMTLISGHVHGHARQHLTDPLIEGCFDKDKV